uniref:Uncharacterized protein n=1 Tax=Arundo donax TaxID=35708 RepID=A0A0A9CP62_ARUDO
MGCLKRILNAYEMPVISNPSRPVLPLLTNDPSSTNRYDISCVIMLIRPVMEKRPKAALILYLCCERHSY